MQIKYIDRASKEVRIEKPPGERYLKFFYHNPVGRLPLHTLIKRKGLSALYGKMMNNPKSTKRIRPFVEQLNIDMSESVKSIDEFASFNDFFYRQLKPETRPIQDGLVSPGDGKILAFGAAHDANTFFVKGREFTLAEFLQNEILASKYANASMVILRLAPNDYHRYHFPYDGIASPTIKIKGSYLSVSPYALASNFTRVFCENKREYTILKTPNKGDIVISPVGATMVGSMISTFVPDSMLNKGDEMGYFAFGGSTIVMLLDSSMTKIDADLLENTQKGMETYVKLGEQIGV